MFFPERIKSIKPEDRVLEIGPGGSPYFRSDVFLELMYDDEGEFKKQRGNVDPLVTEKPVVFYDGNIFPFRDNEFDYVICAQVLEHVPNIPLFLSELTRISKRGYLEYPTVYYDYMYNFSVHLNFILEKNGTVYWMKKDTTPLGFFSEVQKLFLKSLASETSNFVKELKPYFIQGFEWENEIVHQQVEDINRVCYDEQRIKIEKPIYRPVQLTLKQRFKIKAKLLIDKI